jgi:acetyl-CoA carboxylase biotin carboxyl carrier protein
LDIKEIKQIIDLMKRASLAEFEIHEGEFSLRLVREGQAMPAPLPAAATPPPFPQPPAPSAPTHEPAPSASAADPAKLIKSPMVGTFYAAPAPESPAFVQAGDKVQPDTVVCILEAMKVMNEIAAEKSGEIAEVMVENGAAVEYGQPLFRLK